MDTKKIIWVGGIVLVLVILGALFFKGTAQTTAPIEVEDPIVAVFSNGTIDVEATFENDSVTFSHPAVGTVTLPHALSGSGARYTNEDESIVFWNKGKELTLFKDEEIIFTGSTSLKNEETFSADNFSFIYPTALIETYVHLVTWPPTVSLSSESERGCVESGDSVTEHGKTERTTYKGHDYCVTTRAEGAAGSTYLSYTYATLLSGKHVTLDFSLRFPQCLNYDDPERSACIAEQEQFEPMQLTATIIDSLSFTQ